MGGGGRQGGLWGGDWDTRLASAMREKDETVPLCFSSNELMSVVWGRS